MTATVSVQCDLSGLEGDHNQDGTVTLVELPVVAGVPDLDNGGARRQLVVAMSRPDQRLWPSLKAMEKFQVGSAVLRPLEACEPCARLAKLIGRSAPPRELVHTGLRCQVLVPGRVTVGNVLKWW